MKSFLIKYIVAAILGSVFIVFTVPQIVSGRYEPLMPKPVRVASVQTHPANGISDQTPSDPSIEIISDKDKAPKPKKDIEKKVPPKPVKKRPTHYWGVVKRKSTPAFNSSGKFLRSLEPGTLVDIVESKKTKTGIIKVCNIVFKGKTVTNLLIQPVNLQLKGGSFKNTSKDDRTMMSRMGEIISQLSLLKKAERKKNLTRNPLAKEYLAVKAKHKAYWAKVMDLKEKRDTTTGNEQIEYFDKLRKMKGEDIRIGQELEKISKKYKKWNTKNPPTPSPKVMELNKELAVVAEQLRRSKTKDDG